MKETELLSLLLPEYLLEYFTLVGCNQENDQYTLLIEEKNITPKEYSQSKLSSKGFFESVTYQDFPLRGKACFLQIKRRKWLNEDTGKIVWRNWDIVQKGTRMTKEFANFLKDCIG